MTQIFLAYSASGNGNKTMENLDWTKKPLGLLVSFVYLKSYDKQAAPFWTTRPPCTVLDSGAYSAWNAGATIDIDALTAETKSLHPSGEPRWDEAVALDVIGDAAGSLKNALYMKARGAPCYPVFHYGEPWEILQEYKKHFPKVGLSCRFGEPVTKSYEWIGQCFARAWPYRFHSFGWVERKMLDRFPFHTADTASWCNCPSAYGRWKSFGDLSVRGVVDLNAEVDFYLKMQDYLKFRWRKERAAWIAEAQKNGWTDKQSAVPQSTARHISANRAASPSPVST